jgi:hypothetical protein
VCQLADRRPRGAGDALATAALERRDPSVRQAAVIGLGRFRLERHRQVIEKAMADPAPQVRGAAAATLGLYGDEAAADRLGNLALRDDAARARVGAVIGLGRCKVPKAIAWLHRIVEAGDSSEVKLRAMKELYRKLAMRYVGAGPAQRVQWLDQIEWLKTFHQVQAAYAAAGWPLVRHPENLRTHDEPAPGEASPRGPEKGALP